MNSGISWGVHAGKLGAAEDLFLRGSVIAIAWPELGDLAELESAREAFLERYREVYGRAQKERSVSTSVGQVYRFVHDVRIGDLVVYRARTIMHLGMVSGPYTYTASSDYPHRRAVNWLSSISTAALSQGALQELKSMLALFRVRRHAAEIERVFRCETGWPTPIGLTLP
jgi:restriction system protein